METPQADPRRDGTARGRPMRARGRRARRPGCTTAPTTTARRCGIAAPAAEHGAPVADHARAVMQVAAAGTGVRLSRRLDQRAARGRPRTRSSRPGALHARLVAAVPGARVLPGLGPAPGAAGQPVRGHVRLLPRGPARGGRPAAGLRRARAGPACSRSRPPPGRWPGSWSAAWTAVRSPSPSCAALTGLRPGRSRRPAPRRRATDVSDLVIRARRAVLPGRHRARRRGTDQTGQDRRGRALRGRDAGGAGEPSSWLTTRCCCPGWWTPTSTSTSRAGPTGRASRRPPGRPRPAGSPRSSTCR